MSQEEIRIRLPRYLALWLQEFSKAIAMTPDQLLANILNYYYEAWRIGVEGRVKIKDFKYKEIKDLLKEYISKEKPRSNAFILEKFASWVEEQGLNVEDINDNHIEEFLEEYASRRNLKRSSIYVYKRLLRQFIKYIKAKLRAK